MSEPVLVLHGGAGDWGSRDPDEPQIAQQVAELDGVCAEIYERLASNALSALDAVEAAVARMEDSASFNAGRGAALCANGVAELSASIMSGRDRRCGAVALLKRTKNPIQLARLVMDDSPHVFLAGEAADTFGEDQGLDPVSPDYFTRRAAHSGLGNSKLRVAEGGGTVGAVALDRHGDVAAATSTGGLSGQWPGRISDSSVIGAGTYADNDACAVSCTGIGEEFIRLSLASRLSDRTREHGERVSTAAEQAMRTQLAALNGRGGLIAVDTTADFALKFNTEVMFRAWRAPGTKGAAAGS